MREVAERLRAVQREERERHTFKLAAEMVSGGQPATNRSTPKKGVRSNAKSPLQPSKAAKEGATAQTVTSWNKMWSPIKHATCRET